MLAGDKVAQRTPYPFIDRHRGLHLHQLLKWHKRFFRPDLQVQITILNGEASAAVHAREIARTIKRVSGPPGTEPSLVVAAAANAALKRRNDSRYVFVHSLVLKVSLRNTKPRI